MGVKIPRPCTIYVDPLTKGAINASPGLELNKVFCLKEVNVMLIKSVSLPCTSCVWGEGVQIAYMTPPPQHPA